MRGKDVHITQGKVVEMETSTGKVVEIRFDYAYPVFSSLFQYEGNPISNETIS